MDDRAPVRELIRKIAPLDQWERDDLAEAGRWVDDGLSLYRLGSPDVPPWHLVSYFAVLDPTEGRLLLGDHRKSGLWLPPGGHVEPGEHPWEAVLREAREELRMNAEAWRPEPLMLTIAETVGTVARHTDVSFWYVLKGSCALSVEFDGGEYLSVRWFGLDDLPSGRMEPNLLRFVSKLRAELEAST
jgi:8-oxo-dGTP pyrophosphatase MutT (NUDIX family)